MRVRFPKANPATQPSPWWYFGRAVYVSRRDYLRIFIWFATIGVALGLAGLLFHRPLLLELAYGLAVIGVCLLIYSLIGLYRMYGHPSRRYIARLLELGGLAGPIAVADLHIGTYRHAYALADLLPQATIHSIDCWDPHGPAAEPAVDDVRRLESPPTHEPRIIAARAEDHRVPLPTAGCDAVVLGFGTHEISAGPARELLFAEIRRVLRPGGRVLMFEHGIDLHNFLIFGPVIAHVTRRDAWLRTMRRYFEDVRYERSPAAVDLIVASQAGARA